MDHWTAEQLADLRRHDALRAAAAYRRAALLPTSVPMWRVKVGALVVRFGRWVGGEAPPALSGRPPADL